MATTTESTAAAPKATPVQIDSVPAQTSTNAGMTGARVPPSSEAPPESKPAKQTFREENPTNTVLGDDKGNRETEPTLPKFGEAARALIAKKEAEARAESKEKKAEAAEATKEKKAVVSADDAPPKPAAKEDAPVPPEHLKVLPHDKPETARRIKALLADRDAARAEAAAAKAEFDAAKKAGAAPEELTKLREEAQKAAQEAARYRRLVEVDKDPALIAKYDEPAKAAETNIEATLKQYGLGENTLKTIQAEGGFAAFSRSQKAYNVTVADPESEGGTKVVAKTAAQLAHEWLNGMNLADAEAIKAALGKQQSLQAEKVAEKQRLAAEATQYYEQQTAAQRQAAEQAQAQTQKATKEYEDWAKKAETETPFLKDREVPANATPEQKSKIEEYNAFNAQLRASLKKHPTTALEYGQLKLEAAEAHHLRREMGDKDAEIESLKAQLARVRGATRTTSKAGSILTGGGKAPEKEEPADPTDLKGGLRRSLAKLTGGDEE